jgi:uncharacterized protein (DUF305 family)
MTAVTRARVLRAGAVVLLVGLGVVLGAVLFGRAEDAPRPSAADIGFSQDMIVHHQQAVTMAELVRGKVTPQVAVLAEQIAANQLREIGQMQGWLTLWNAPQTASAPMAWMTAGQHQHDGSAPMPGMVSMPELAELGGLSGPDADIRFLRLMIRHHQGGIDMATAATTRVADPHVRDLAQLVIADQQQEIGTMAILLRDR